MSSQVQPASLAVDGNLDNNDVMFCADTGTYYTILTPELFMIQRNITIIGRDPATGKCTSNYKSLEGTGEYTVCIANKILHS